jgi:hypothetical protein
MPPEQVAKSKPLLGAGRRAPRPHRRRRAGERQLILEDSAKPQDSVFVHPERSEYLIIFNKL